MVMSNISACGFTMCVENEISKQRGLCASAQSDVELAARTLTINGFQKIASDHVDECNICAQCEPSKKQVRLCEPVGDSIRPRVSSFAWNLTQDRVDCIAQCLYKLETILNIAAPGFLAAENVACLVTDLRAQVCAAGADDPFPYMPMAPRFSDTIVTPNPSDIWGEEAIMQ